MQKKKNQRLVMKYYKPLKDLN